MRILICSFGYVGVLVTMVLGQQTSSTYLDIGGVFPLLTANGLVDPLGEGQQRQAGW